MRFRWHPVFLLVLSVISFGNTGQAQTLREAADQIGLLVGAAVRSVLLSNPDYAATLARQFNMVEAENEMKWRATEPSRGVFDFRAGDRIVAFAQAHGMKVRGHNLLWGKYNPQWLTDGHFTPNELRNIMKNHIQMVVRHYRGQVFAWDVVNEAIDSQGHVRHTLWYDQPGIGLAGKGTAYIAQAFRWAHEADPHALLFYNDYAADGVNAKSDAIYEMLKDFKREGVPVNGVGLQMHIFTPKDVPTRVAENIARFTKLGLEVHITEMDVALPLDARGQASATQLEWQAKVYRTVASACARNPGCTAFQTWGFTDRYSWIPAYTHGKRGAALLFDASYKPKPAYRAVLAAFDQARKADSKLKEQRVRFEQKAASESR
ncbi:MAG TPA: endo-1,4-beta-xylanase [Terriglobia bacterium]|nr:endo-1,4-beta-xylanase [Terriglobia bacterium]